MRASSQAAARTIRCPIDSWRRGGWAAPRWGSWESQRGRHPALGVCYAIDRLFPPCTPRLAERQTPLGETTRTPARRLALLACASSPLQRKVNTLGIPVERRLQIIQPAERFIRANQDFAACAQIEEGQRARPSRVFACDQVFQGTKVKGKGQIATNIAVGS